MIGAMATIRMAQASQTNLSRACCAAALLPIVLGHVLLSNAIQEDGTGSLHHLHQGI